MLCFHVRGELLEGALTMRTDSARDAMLQSLAFSDDSITIRHKTIGGNDRVRCLEFRFMSLSIRFVQLTTKARDRLLARLPHWIHQTMAMRTKEALMVLPPCPHNRRLNRKDGVAVKAIHHGQPHAGLFDLLFR